METERFISEELMQKLDDWKQLLQSIVSECDPGTLDEEKSFQKRFMEKALLKAEEYDFTIDDEIKTVVLASPETTCISDEKVTFWKVDFIMHVDNALIPIELKIRHKNQDISGYAQDFIDDVDRIRKILINYDDCPKGYAIMLTNNVKLKEQCDDLAAKYTRENNLKDDHVVCITWKSIANNYFVGIVGRMQFEERLNKPKNAYFLFLSEEQLAELENK